MIVVADLTKKFDSKPVIQGLSFKIKPGEIVGLLGPNGAGKTTTLRMLAGVLPPTGGTIEINGQNFGSEAEKIKKNIGFLPEDNPLYEELTVEEYLNFWAEIKEVPAGEKQAAIDFVVKNCGIKEVYYRPISELSKGYRQRVGLAQAILTQPDILLLDEPTEGLDPNQRHDIAGLIMSLGKERTVIISSHVLSEVAKICTRLMIIHQGKIVADDTPENMRRIGENSTLIEAELLGENIQPTLEKLPGVKSVTNPRPNYYLIEAGGKTDLRRTLFETAISNHWILLTLTRKERGLEEVFSELTITHE